jgi:hypothetical protein
MSPTWSADEIVISSPLAVRLLLKPRDDAAAVLTAAHARTYRRAWAGELRNEESR